MLPDKYHTQVRFFSLNFAHQNVNMNGVTRLTCHARDPSLGLWTVGWMLLLLNENYLAGSVTRKFGVVSEFLSNSSWKSLDNTLNQSSSPVLLYFFTFFKMNNVTRIVINSSAQLSRNIHLVNMQYAIKIISFIATVQASCLYFNK